MRLKPGDRVRIKDFGVIRKTLDADRCCEGLLFDKGMEKLSGQVFLVLKEVHKIMDYYKRGFRKFEDTYILDGVYCEGTEAYPSCDRMCHYFWKGQWLEKLN